VRRGRLAGPGLFALLLLAVLFAGPGAGGDALFALLLLTLLATVAAHRRLQRRSLPAARPLLATPLQVALGVLAAVVLGAVLTVVVSIVLSAAVPSLVGDGALLVRLLLALLVLGPCFSIGCRCGRWWAFAGGAVLLPVLGLSALLAAPGSPGGLGFLALSVAAVSLAVAGGSLQRQLRSPSRRGVQARSGERPGRTAVSGSRAEPPGSAYAPRRAAADG
jgi:hypothetical protein